MGLFHFGKKKEEEKACACGCSCGEAPESVGACCGRQEADIRCVKVLGAGCKSCHEQYENAKAAVAAMGLAIEVEYITDMEKVMTYGVMRMPAIVVNDQVAAMGKVLKASEVEALLRGFQK